MKKIICPNCGKEILGISICYENYNDDYELQKDGYYHLVNGYIPQSDKTYICNNCNNEITDENIIEEIDNLLA